MIYEWSKLKSRELKENEKYYTIRYMCFHRNYKVKIAASSQSEARKEFFRLFDKDNCQIHTINFT